MSKRLMPAPDSLPFKRVLLWNALFWIVLWLFSVWNNYQWANSAGAIFSWDIVFSWSFPYYIIMVLAGPLIYLLYRWWRRHRYPNQFLYHLTPAAILGFIHQLSLNAFYILFSPAGKADLEQTFGELLAARYSAGFIFSVNGFLFYWLCLGLIFSADLYQRYRHNEKTNLALQSELNKARFETLQQQLQPHFLFNTFNSLSMMARQQKHKEVVHMIAMISDLLRETLSLGGQQKVPLKKELQLINHYLNIEQIRFRDRLTITQDISADAGNCDVPVLFLQPVVENAFQHGISKSEKAANLDITARVEKHELVILVSNSGPLLPDNWQLEDELGIGLSNVLKRLDHTYQKNFSLSLNNRKDQSGVITQINLPLD